MARSWNALRIILLLAGGLAAFVLTFFLIGAVAWLMPPGVAMIFAVLVMLAAYFLIGRWVFRRL